MSKWNARREAHRRVLRAPLRYLDDQVLVTNESAWTYVVAAHARAGMQSDAEVVHYVLRNSRALARLVTGDKPVRCHLRVMRQVSHDTMGDAIQHAAHAHPVWQRSVELQEALSAGTYETRVLLGVELGSTVEESFFNTGPFKWLRKARDRVEEQAGLVGEIISLDDLDELHRRAAQLRATLSPIGPGASAAEVQRHILSVTNPGLGTPRRYLAAERRFGPGIERVLMNDPVEIHNRMISYLDIDDAPFLHSAYVPLSRTDEEWAIGETEPWMYAMNSLGFPIEWSLRFDVIPLKKVKKDLQKGIAHAKDQERHMLEARKEPPRVLAEKIGQIDNLEAEATSLRLPGLSGQYVAHVWAADPQELAGRVERLREELSDYNIAAEWSTGDQEEFALSACPGYPDRYRPYDQHTNIFFPFSGAPSWSDEVGDKAEGLGWRGGRIGETTLGTPVRYDPYVAPARNFSPCTVIVGESGSGKTYLFCKLVEQLAEKGATVDVIDPKPDIFDPEGRFFRLPDLVKHLTGEEPQMLDVAHAAPGSLDFFGLCEDRGEGILLCQSSLYALLGIKSTDSVMSAPLLAALNKAAEDDDPSVALIMRLLAEARGSSAAADAIYQQLNLFSRMPYARLFIGEEGNKVRPFRREPGVFTAITTRGLKLPSADMRPEDYEVEDRISSLVLSLVVRQCARSLTHSLDRLYPKALFCDEAQIITATAPGRRMINDAVTMLRSRGGVVGLASQTLRGFSGTADKEADRVLKNVSTIFAFRQKDRSEAKSMLDALKSGVDEGWGLETLQELPSGQCLMRDVDSRLGHVIVDRELLSERYAFETNVKELEQITPDMINRALAEEYDAGPWVPAPLKTAPTEVSVSR